MSNIDIHFRSTSSMWETPQDLFDFLNSMFKFDLDAAACRENTKCDIWLGPGSTINEDSLKEEWTGKVWLNPPYGRGIGKWVKKAYESSIKNDATIVCLLPARTDTKWFQYVWKATFVCFVHGRLKFGGAETSAPFPSCIAIFGNNLPHDLEISMLAAKGTITRPIWLHNPIDEIRWDFYQQRKEEREAYAYIEDTDDE